jgi:hypothetical protein
MIIREEQLGAFSESLILDYKRRVEKHLRRCFPNQCAHLTEGDIRKLIQNGIVRSAKYGVVGERDVCLFIDLMFVFGMEFDMSDWAAQILGDPWRTDPTQKIDCLFDAGLTRVRKQSLAESTPE